MHDPRTVFLAIRGKVLEHAEFTFRYVRCPQRRDDYVAEAVGLVWLWTLSLCARGKDARTFPTTLASFATRAVRCGRKVCGARLPKDALCEIAQAAHSFVARSLPVHPPGNSNPLRLALIDNTQTPPDEQAAFRLDFPAWRESYDQRRRCLMDALMLGARTQDVAREFRCSPARISQMRREFHTDWLMFTGVD